MSTLSNDKTVEHLMHLILTRNGRVPNFSLLLGSGASFASGVRTANGMIEEWRMLLFSRSASSHGYQEWLKSQSWSNHEDEYSMLFEMIYDQPSQRRIYVEECVKSAHPSWGYVYLTNLLTEQFFDVVFTTNFDDLINEACYLYSDGLRPMVAAHDSAIQGIRVTSSRPKIVKLHGDFLYDNIKNTLAELETLETNTKRKLVQFAQEYGLIVLGYGGRDRSVMDVLELLLRDENNYRQGVYWCIKRDTEKSRRLESLLRRDRVYLVEVDGFDEFMADLHKAAQLRLPKPIRRPFEMARDRARLFVEHNKFESHKVIGAHIREVLANINTHSPTVPLHLQAAIESSRGEIDRAIPIWRQAHEEEPSDEHIAHGYADALAVAEEYDELTAFVPNAPLAIADKTYFLLRSGENQKVIDLATTDLNDPATIRSSRESSPITRINRAIALKRLGRTEAMRADLDVLEQNGDTSEASVRAGVAALRRDKDEMFRALDKALHDTITPSALEAFPVFEDYREDPDFVELMKEAANVDHQHDDLVQTGP